MTPAIAFTDDERQPLSQMPTLSGLPVLGKTLSFLSDAAGFLDEGAATCGTVFKTNLFFEDIITIAEPSLIQEVLVDPRSRFSAKKGWDGFFNPLFEGALLLRDHGEHRDHRRMMQSAFSRRAMRGYQELFDEVIPPILAEWPADGPVSIAERMRSLITTVATRVILGADPGEEVATLARHYQNMADGTSGVIKMELPFLLFGKGMRSRRWLLDYLSQQLPSKKGSTERDFFSRLCSPDEGGLELSDEEVLNHLLFTMIAATDTTTSSLTTLFCYLTMYPRYAETLRSHLSDRVSFDRWVDALFKEVVRLHPPLFLIARGSTEDVTLGGYHVPAGSTIHISPHLVHRDPRFWTRPEHFEPERFMEGRQEHKQHRFSYIPFGSGAHVCIGMAMAQSLSRSILFHAIQSLDWTAPEGWEPEFALTPVVGPKNSSMYIERRHGMSPPPVCPHATAGTDRFPVCQDGTQTSPPSTTHRSS